MIPVSISEPAMTALIQCAGPILETGNGKGNR
jgi:hypothetical protein